MTEKEFCDKCLRNAFRILKVPLSAKGVSPAIERVLSCYEEPHRMYHTLAHLTLTFKVAGTLAFLPTGVASRRISLETWAKSILALAYHDAIYEIGSKQNEYRSAMLAFDTLSTWLPMEIAQEISQSIRQAVTLSIGVEASPLLKLVHDADFAILSSPQPIYRTYVDDIRGEYEQVPDEQFYPGRRTFLMDAIAHLNYSNIAPQNLREATARDNMRWELHYVVEEQPCMREVLGIEFHAWRDWIDNEEFKP